MFQKLTGVHSAILSPMQRQRGNLKAEAATGKAEDVDEYLAAVPEKERAVLEELRRTIKAVAQAVRYPEFPEYILSSYHFLLLQQ